MITVVSGLPRSGTSLMMQMLAAGGMAVLTDGRRTPDIENPRGYYEWETIKSLPLNPQCIAEAEGKAVKVISQLLFALPADCRYQIIFMERPLAEVLASQTEMIRRMKSSAASVPPSAMLAALQAHLNQVQAWLARQKNAAVQRVKYGEVINQPRAVAENIRDFLHEPLDVDAMAAQIDPALYRQRAASGIT